MINDIMLLIADRDAAKRRARSHLEAMMNHRVGSMNHGWHEGQLEDTLREHAEVCAAIEEMGYLQGHAVTVDNSDSYPYCVEAINREAMVGDDIAYGWWTFSDLEDYQQ